MTEITPAVCDRCGKPPEIVEEGADLRFHCLSDGCELRYLVSDRPRDEATKVWNKMIDWFRLEGSPG